MAKKDSPKASARGRRKSLVEEYKAKARGKKTSQVKSKSKPVKRKPLKPKAGQIKYEPCLYMKVGEEEYQQGDVAYYILEGRQFSKRVHSGDIKECHPNDNTAPCVTVWDHTFGSFRVIRARLIGWSKAEAKKRWQEYLKDNPKASKEK